MNLFEFLPDLLGPIGKIPLGMIAQEEISKEQEYKEAMYDKQIADRDKLIADDRAYNDPSAQAQRLLRAGFNPFYNPASLNSGATFKGSVIETPEYTEYADNVRGNNFNLENVMNLLSFGRTMALNTKQQEIMDLQKNKLMNDITLSLDKATRDDESSDLTNDINELKRKQIKMQNTLLENELKDEEKLEKFGGKTAVKEAKEIIKMLIQLSSKGRRR